MAELIHVLASGIEVSGSPAAGYTVDFYRPGTLDRVTVYAEDPVAAAAEGRTPEPLSNPETLDANGAVEAWATVPVRIIVKSPSGTTVRDIPYVTRSALTTDDIAHATLLQDMLTATTLTGSLLTALLSLGSQNLDQGVASDFRLCVTNGEPRYVHEWAADVHNVKNFGAAGDGSTDDTTAIQAVITAMGTAGGCLYFPPGTYLLSAALTFAGYSNVTVLGAGPRTILRGSASTVAPLVFSGTCDGIAIEDLQIYGAGTTASSAAIGITIPSGATDVLIRNVRFNGPSNGTGLNVGVSVAGQGVRIEHCTFRRLYSSSATTGIGVRLEASNQGVLIGHCEFYMQDGGGTRGVSAVYENGAGSGDLRIISPYITGASGAGLALGNTNGCTQVEITGGSIKSCQGHGIDLTLCDNARVTGVYIVSSGTTGIHAGYVGAVGTTRVRISDCVIQSAGTHGVHLEGTSTAGTHPTFCVVSNTTVQSAGRHGFFLEATDNCKLEDCTAINCSQSVAGTYNAFTVTTVTTGANCGGTDNVITNPVVRDESSNHLYHIALVDSAGGVTNVDDTRICGGDVPSGGIPLRIGTTEITRGNTFGLKIGGSAPSPILSVANANASWTGYDSGLLIAATASTVDVFLTLPPSSGVPDGFDALATKVAGVNVLEIDVGAVGDTIIEPTGVGVLQLSTSAVGACIHLRKTGTTWLVVSHSSTSARDWT